MSDKHLMDVLTQGRKPTERDDDRELPPESHLPDPSRGYEPFSRPANKPIYTLHCVLGRGSYQSFQYVGLDAGSTFHVDEQGQVIRLRFCGSKTFAVIIRGRNVLRLYDDIHQHRTTWVMQVDRGRDFGADNEPIVTSIEIEEVKNVVDG